MEGLEKDIWREQRERQRTFAEFGIDDLKEEIEGDGNRG
jgi:hypothetical protein